jgi:hypothetical protein
LGTGKPPKTQAHRLNLYLTPSVYAEIKGIMEERGNQSPTEVVQQCLRIGLLAFKHEANLDEGLYWKRGDVYSKLKLI